MSEPWIHVRDTQGGEQWTFIPGNGGVTCPHLEKMSTGDGQISWSYTFVQYQDRLPPRHGHVTVNDELGVIQTGRIMRRTPPDTAHCTGPCALVAEGYAVSLGDQRFTTSTTMGPTWDGTTIALTPEDAIIYALTRAPGVEMLPITPSGITLGDTQDFVGGSPMDIINSMTALGAGLATPYVWSVRAGKFRWETLDPAPRYQVLCANGAVLAASDDIDRLFVSVTVLWGNGRAATFPDTISYGQLPTLKDLTVNAGGEVTSQDGAQRLAEALYGRLQTLELGWTGTLTIPGNTQIADLFPGSSGYVHPWRLEAQRFIRIPDLNGFDRYGHRVPDVHLITHARWDGTKLICDLGETRTGEGMMRLMHRMMYGGLSRVSHALWDPSLSVPSSNGDRTPLLGPAHVEDPGLDANGQPKPAPIANWVPALSTEHRQTLVTHEAPKPFKVIEAVATNNGAVFTAGLLDTSDHSTDFPPGEIDNVILRCSPLGTITVEVYTAAQDPSSDGRGAFTKDPTTKEFIPNDLVLTATVTADKSYQHRFTGATGDTKPRITTDAMLLYKVVAPITDVTSFRISMSGNRIVPGHPAGYDTAPALGSRSV